MSVRVVMVKRHKPAPARVAAVEAGPSGRAVDLQTLRDAGLMVAARYLANALFWWPVMADAYSTRPAAKAAA